MSNSPLIPFSATIEVRDHCLCLHTQRAARALSRRFDNAFKHLGLTSGQFSLLMSLNRPKPPTLGSVASLLGMDRTTLTAALKVLEKHGWVNVAKNKEDRREKSLGITPAGLACLAAALPIWIDMHATIEAQMPQGDADRLRHGLNAIS